jgi:hypothetical protein
VRNISCSAEYGFNKRNKDTIPWDAAEKVIIGLEGRISHKTAARNSYQPILPAVHIETRHLPINLMES